MMVAALIFGSLARDIAHVFKAILARLKDHF
jgi:hypothetical protein